MDGTAVLRDVAYAEPVGAAHLLDLYLPARADEPVPLLVWSGGSAFMRDDGKDTAGPVAEYFRARGYAVAGVSVRSSSQAVFPAQLDDAKSAVTWLRRHASQYGLDAGRFAFMGYSSGGWVAAMAALTGVPGAADSVQAAVDFYGPTDFLQMDAHMIDGCRQFRARLGVHGCHDDPASPESRLIGGPIEQHPERCTAANPISYVTPSAPPFLILHGQVDPYVPHHQSELLYDALGKAGADATFYSIPEMGHEHPYVTDAALAAGYVVRTTVPERASPPPTWAAVESFLGRALGS